MNSNVPNRIIVCCDGTGKSEFGDISESRHTNVSRLSYCIRSKCPNGSRQIVSYIAGIGTESTNSIPEKMWSQIVGAGLSEKMKQAYAFICHNYDKQSQDEIILIGFSRGAFLVRCLADLILKVGVLRKAGLHRLLKVHGYWAISSHQNNQLETYCDSIPDNEIFRNVKVKVCAVWDTVSSILIDGPSFIHSDLPRGIENAFQALSPDDKRHRFLPIVWSRPSSLGFLRASSRQRLEQCWFTGYHADIGGGRERESLAHFALAWMISKLDEFVEFDYNIFWRPAGVKSCWKLNTERLDVTSMSVVYSFLGTQDRWPGVQFWDKKQLKERPPPANRPLEYEKMHSTVRFLYEFHNRLDDRLAQTRAQNPSTQNSRTQNSRTQEDFQRMRPPTCKALRYVAPERQLVNGRQIRKWNLQYSISDPEAHPSMPWWDISDRGMENVPSFFLGSPSTFASRRGDIVDYSVDEEELGNREIALLTMWVQNDHTALLENSEPGDPRPNTILPDFSNFLYETDPVAWRDLGSYIQQNL
ncbi:hypothetical protein TWF694_005126 [Orbilia ellipsospora]|uniref:T6SS Phospholipase effector Tle1-like catalytic domain-containing protein n=1 Tax=Orbilia ellipsospora TaxID=2528407 RepID=A0AAV9WUN3_9PEZI